MKSIRTYLLLALLAIITLVTFISLLQGYNSSIQEAHQIFDSRLKNMAEVIAMVNHDKKYKSSALQHQYSPSVFFQIWSDDSQLISRSDNAPHIRLSISDTDNHFNDVNFDRYRWRVFTLRDEQLKRWIITAERADIRNSLAEDMVLASIVPIVLAIPFAALIIWIAIGFGLKPLSTLSSQLSHKKAEDLSPVELENNPVELSQLVITTNALLARLDTAFRREQQFSADAAHELRTPISLLKIQLHNLEVDNGHQLDLKPISQGIERMGLVIEQILSLYRHSPDQAAQTKEAVDLFVVTQQLIAKHYDQFANKNQQISLLGEVGHKVQGNQFALETLAQNLISNASKYTPDDGEIRVEISLEQENLLFSVEDSGPGIAKELHTRVLERFYRVNGDQHDSGTIGCGLGLAIVKQLCVLHHADIELDDSTALGGLKVLIRFPHDSVA